MLFEIRAALFLVPIRSQSFIEYRAEHSRSRTETVSFTASFAFLKFFCDAVRHVRRERESVLGFRVEVA
ncbi:hypothetical protein WK47_26310 [Burkholderia ubonensis]|nr:hypothetical protein WI90_13715 [Burkholderia ubonensis]KVT00041.1 hypothetical protein WK47_26310 [Burkholderia ubonensis]KVT12264.1 hypothetical protein WK46_03925 [Burkholderia ubonensis]KVT36838.1 hypothetical protein WK50_28785 [Burkholderia ubonensis]